jgi:hypothetical protein
MRKQLFVQPLHLQVIDCHCTAHIRAMSNLIMLMTSTNLSERIDRWNSWIINPVPRLKVGQPKRQKGGFHTQKWIQYIDLLVFDETYPSGNIMSEHHWTVNVVWGVLQQQSDDLEEIFQQGVNS